MVRRRTVLRRGLGALGVAGVGTLAGYQEELPDGEGDGDDGDAGEGDGSGPSWASWLYDPTSVGEVDAHGFATYDTAELLSYRDRVPEEVDEGIDELFADVDDVSAEDFDRITGQAYGQFPDPDAGGEAPPFGWSVVAVGSFDSEALVEELSDTDAYEDAGEYEGFRLFEGPSREELDAAVAVGSDAVLGGGTVEYDVDATTSVELAIDAESGGGDRYYGTHEYVGQLMDRHGDGTTAAGVVDPDGSFGDFVEENGGANEYEDLFESARAVGRSTTVGEDTTEAEASLQFEDPDPEAAEDVRDIVDEAQSSRGDPEGPFSDPEVTVDGSTVVVTATADTDRALSTPTGLALIAPEAAIAGAFVLNVGGTEPTPDHEQAPQATFSYEVRDDGRVEITHNGGDYVDALQVLYEVEGGDRVQETWSPSDGVVAGSRYVTEQAAEPGTDLVIFWEDGGQSQIVDTFAVPEN